MAEVEEKEVALAERVSKNETLLASHVNFFQSSSFQKLAFVLEGFWSLEENLTYYLFSLSKI